MPFRKNVNLAVRVKITQESAGKSGNGIVPVADTLEVGNLTRRKAEWSQISMDSVVTRLGVEEGGISAIAHTRVTERSGDNLNVGRKVQREVKGVKLS
jgi:hypothetical protein